MVGALTLEEEMHLILGSTLLPKVWAKDGRLLYDHEVPKDVLSVLRGPNSRPNWSKG